MGLLRGGGIIDGHSEQDLSVLNIFYNYYRCVSLPFSFLLAGKELIYGFVTDFFNTAFMDPKAL